MTPPSTPAELLAAMERCGRATEGPWEAVHNPRHEESRIYSGLTQRAMFDGRLLLGERDDCEFSAKARTDVPAQLALIAELLDVIARGFANTRDAALAKFADPEWRDVAQKLREAR